MGRSKGSQNRGYFYRAGRGWYSNDEGKMTPLRDEDGNPLKDKDTPYKALKAAYRQMFVGRGGNVNAESNQHEANAAPLGSAYTVHDVCSAYLNKAEAERSSTTYDMRADTIFDFLTGYPARFRVKNKGDKPKEKSPRDQIHQGFGHLLISEFLPLHVDQWLAAHKGWHGSRRTHIKALKRAMNYGVESGMIQNPPGSPLKDYKVPQAIARITYLTPEQEHAMLKVVKPAFAMALKACIRTGMRPGSEFGNLTANRVKECDKGIQIILAPRRHKTGGQTGKSRIIWVTDEEIKKIIREQMEKYPSGEIFRNSKGTKWTYDILNLNFRRAKARLRKQGIELDEDAVMYSTRHTYAKRILQGYWSGKPTTVDYLARLMGISSQVCRDHYLTWTTSYEEVLWECA